MGETVSLKAVVMMENHDEAYLAWRKAGLQNRILVHCDPHIDFNWIAEAAPEDILRAPTKSALDGVLSKKVFWNFSTSDFQQRVHIGNYIYPAIQEGIVREFFWVLPDGMAATPKDLKRVFLCLSSLRKSFPERVRNLRMEENKICCVIDGVPTTACALAHLPCFSEPVLLDIDTDFFVFGRWDSAYPHFDPDHIAVWLKPEEWVGRLRAKQIASDFVTIAYSVEGGYTPAPYRYLGDDLKNILQKSPPTDLPKKTFPSAFDNYGRVYQLLGKWEKSREALEAALKSDPKNPTTLCHLGHCFAKDKNWNSAAQCYKEALEIKPDLEEALYHLALMQVHQRRPLEAISLLEAPLKDFQFERYFLLGKLYRKTKQWSKAFACYEELIRNGNGVLKVHFYLGCLYLRQRRYYKMWRRFQSVARGLWRHYAFARNTTD